MRRNPCSGGGASGLLTFHRGAQRSLTCALIPGQTTSALVHFKGKRVNRRGFKLAHRTSWKCDGKG